MMVVSRRSSKRNAPGAGLGRLRLLLTWIAAVVVLSAAGAVEAADRPPTNLKKVGDHWTPWSPPPAGPNDYIIEKGDTLWDLAGKWFGDPFLWPQIWDENRYVLDSHWIYPGDPLVVPGRPTVVPEDEAPPAGDLGDAGDGQDKVVTAPPQIVVEPEPLVAAADPADLYCSGYIEQYPTQPSFQIARGSTEKVSQAQGDVVYLNAGRNAGIRAGDEYAIIRNTDPVKHPVTKQTLGTFVRRLGKLSVMLVHEESATAVIDFSCEDTVAGDALVPWADIPVPMMSSLPPLDRWAEMDPSDSAGYIVTLLDRLSAVGTGHVIYVDMGQDEGLLPGDVLTMFREQDGSLPPIKLGQAVVLTVQSESATAKIVQSVREAYVGDRVEVSR